MNVRPALLSDVMSKDGFTRYLMSDENAPVFLDRLDIYQVGTVVYVKAEDDVDSIARFLLGHGPTALTLLHQLQSQHVSDGATVRRQVQRRDVQTSEN